MIYIEQDFYSNFTSAVKSNDDSSVQNMLSDEISRLISSRKDLLDLLKKININYSEQPTNEELSNIIVSNIISDNKLRVGIAYLISKNNGLLFKEKQERENKDNKTDKKTDTVVLISTNIGTFVQSNKDNLNSFKEDLILKSNNKSPNYSKLSLDKKEELSKLDKPKSTKKNKTWLWVTLGLIVIGGGVYLAYKKGWIKFGNSNNLEPNLMNNGADSFVNNSSNVVENSINQTASSFNQIPQQQPINLVNTNSVNV